MFDYLVVQYSKEFKDEIEDDSDGALPLKHELISCLSVGGRWITSQSNLQVSIILLSLRINRRGIVASGFVQKCGIYWVIRIAEILTIVPLSNVNWQPKHYYSTDLSLPR